METTRMIKLMTGYDIYLCEKCREKSEGDLIRKITVCPACYRKIKCVCD